MPLTESVNGIQWYRSMHFEWDPAKDEINREKHGISFEEASEIFQRDNDYLEIYDEEHSEDEERLIAVGPIRRGVVVVSYTERPDDVIRLISARPATKKEVQLFHQYFEDNHE